MSTLIPMHVKLCIGSVGSESFWILLHPTESLQIPSNLQFPKSSGIRSFLVAAHWHSLSGVFVVESITRPKNSEPHWGPASQRLVHFVAPWVTTANAQCHWKSGTFKGRWILSSQLFEVSLSTRDPPQFVFRISIENSHVMSTVATSKYFEKSAVSSLSLACGTEGLKHTEVSHPCVNLRLLPHKSRCNIPEVSNSLLNESIQKPTYQHK